MMNNTHLLYSIVRGETCKFSYTSQGRKIGTIWKSQRKNMKITHNPLAYSWQLSFSSVSFEACSLVFILTGYSLLEGIVCVLHLHLQRRWHHLRQLIQKSVQCEIQMGRNKIKGKGIHELKQSQYFMYAGKFALIHILLLIETFSNISLWK